MIYAIAALDEKDGIATSDGIPWDLPSDRDYVHHKITGSAVIMGYKTYTERVKPRKDGDSFVIARASTPLRDGFRLVEDPVNFLKRYQSSSEVIWIAGGAKIYQELLPLTQKLYLTRINGDFNCTKFFPEFRQQFKLTSQSQEKTENKLKFCYEVWDSQAILK